jgi:hypothetical protein
MNVLAAVWASETLPVAVGEPDAGEGLDTAGELVAGTETDGDPAAVADAVVPPAALEADAAVELLADPHAVASNATQASPPPAATCRNLREFVVHMISNPSTMLSGSASHVTSTTSIAQPWLGPAWRRGVTTARSA